MLASTLTLSLLAAAGAHGSGEITSLFSGQAVIALITLTLLEIVLGIDNIIFISVLADKLPAERQNRALLRQLPPRHGRMGDAADLGGGAVSDTDGGRAPIPLTMDCHCRCFLQASLFDSTKLPPLFSRHIAFASFN